MLVLGSKSFEESYVVALRKVSKLNYVYPVCSYLGRVFKGTESSPPNAAKSVLSSAEKESHCRPFEYA